MTSTTIGWIGSILLAFCGLPELFRTIRKKKCYLSWPFLLMWGIGELCTLIAVIDKNLGLFLLINYSANLIIILIMAIYKSKKKDEDATFIY